MLGFLLGAIAIVFGVLALRGRQHTAMSVTGLVTGAIGALTSLVVTAILVVNAGAVLRGVTDAAPASSEAPASTASQVGETTVVYSVESDVSQVTSISWATTEAGGLSQQQATDTSMPWSEEVKVPRAGQFDYQAFTLVAQAGQDASSVTCRITVDGVVKAENTSTGPFAVVTCTVSSLD